MGNLTINSTDFSTTKRPLFIPGKPNLHAIYGPWNSKEEAIEVLEYCNVIFNQQGELVTEIPAGSTVAIYDNNLHTSVTEYWWKDGSLVQKSNNNSMIYTIVTDYDFIVYNDVIPTPGLLKVKRINYGLNNISDDVDLGKLAYRIDEGEWNYVNHSTHEDEKVIYDDTNKYFVFYLNTLRPLTLVLFRWYDTNDDGSIGELLTTKSLLVTATSNDVLELFFPTDEILSLELIDTNSMPDLEFVIPSDYDTNPKWAAYYNAYLKNNHLKLKTGEKEWLDLMPQYSTDNQFNYVYKITRERKYGRWQPFNGPELVFIKGMDGSIKYEEVFYVTDQFGSLNLITTPDFNLLYSPDYDSEDEFIISNGSKSEQWSRTCKEVSASNLYRYARKRFLKSDGTYDVDWSYPYLHATYKPNDSYENIYKKSKKGLEEALGEEIRDINTYLGEHPDAKFSDLPLDELRGWSYSALSLEESGDIICLAYRGFSEDTVSFYQGPFVIGSYGENGLDGGNVEYIYKSSNQGTIQGFVNSVIGDFRSWNEFAESLLHKPDEYDRPYQGGIDGEYVIDGWSDDCPVRDAINPYIYMIHRKYSGVDKLWGLYSEPKLWDKFIAYELVVSNKTPLIPSRYEGYSLLAAKNATITTIKLFAGGDLIESGYTLSWSLDDVYVTDGEGNYWMDDGIEKGSGCIVNADDTYNITVTASYNGIEVASQTIYITRQDTDAYQLHVNPNVRIYLGDNDYSVDNYELYVTKLDVDGNYSKDNSGQYLLVLDDVGAELSSTIMKYDASNPLGQQTAINNFINNPEYISNDLMLYLYHWENRFNGKTDSWIKNHLGERLDVTLINTINASDVIDSIDGNYQIALNYDTLNIPSSKIGEKDWFVNHKIQARVLHNGQINICNIVAHIDVLNTPLQEDDYLIENNQRVRRVTSDNGVLNILIALQLDYEAILTVEAEIEYDRGSEYGTYTLTKNIPVHISTEAEVLNLSDNVGVLYADNLGEYGIDKIEFTVYDEVKELQYLSDDIEINVSCSEQSLAIATKLIYDSETYKWYLHLDTDYVGPDEDLASQAAFMKVILEYLSNLDNGNMVSIICTLVKNSIEKSRQIIEIDFTAVKQSGIDIDMKNDSITLPIGWTSITYNSVANIDCNIHINNKEISKYEGYSYTIECMTDGVTIAKDNNYGYYISNCNGLTDLGLYTILLKITITHTVGESTKTYEILKQVSLHITNKDFYYLEFTTKALNAVIDSSEITQNVYYDIYKYENGKSIKLSGLQNNLYIRFAKSMEESTQWSSPVWNAQKNIYVIENMPIEYNVTDYVFILSFGSEHEVLDYVELPVLYYGKSDRRIYYLMQLTKGYELPNMFITYDLSYAMINAVHTYFKNTSSLSYEDFVDGFYTFVIDSVGSGNYTVTRKEDADWYYSHNPENENQYICLIAVGSTAFGVSPLSPYEYYAIQLMKGTEYGEFGNIIVNSSLGQDGYGRRYIYLKTDKVIEDIDNYYLNQEDLSRNINNRQDFLNDEFVPDIRDGNDIWSDNILEPDVYQKYVYEFSDKKVNNIWLPFTSFILRSHFDSVFQFNNDNNNIIVDNDALDDDIKEITKTRFSFFDGEINHKLYIIGISDDSRNIYVSTSKNGNAEYTISLDYSGLLITQLSYDTDTKEFIQYTLGRTEGKFIASKFLLTYSIYKYASEAPHHGELMAISNSNIVVKDFNSGEIYKIITNPTQIGVRAVDNTGTSYVLEDLYKSGGSISNLNLYFYAYSNGSITSLIKNNELDEDFYFTIDGVQCGLNLFDHCVYEELSEYNEKHIKDIIFKTDQYSFTSQASSRLTAEKCGSIIIEGTKRDIKYYKSGNYRYLYCAYDNSNDSYYFYVQRDGNDYKTWERVTGSESLDVTFVSFTTLGNGFISDGIVFEPSSEGDHFEIKIEDIFKDTALPNLINLFYQGGDFILNPTIVDSLTISYVKAGLPGDDVLPMVKYTVEPLNSVFLVDEDGKYSKSDLQLVYHIIAEYGIDKKSITVLNMDSVTINGTSIPNNQSTEAYYEYGLNGDEFTITIRNYNTLQSLLLKLRIRINCTFTCTYDEGKEYSRIVSMFATPISSSSPNITYEFVPNVTSIGLVWSYGSSYYFPNELYGELYILIGDKRDPMTLDGNGNIIYSSSERGTYYWRIIGANDSKIGEDEISTRLNLRLLLNNKDCYTIRFCYTINEVLYTYDIPVNKGLLQEYFISVKGTASGSIQGSTAALSKISLLEGTSVIDNISTSSGDSEGILLAVFDTSNKLYRVNNTINTIFYNLSQLTDLCNVLNTSYKDSKYIICLASYKQINLTTDLYTLLQQFGLGDLRYVLTTIPAAKTPFAFIGCYGLAKGKACYQEAQALPTASSVEISAKIVDGTLDFSRAGEDGKNGQDVVRIDIDNQQDAISIKSGKVRFKKDVVVKARIYKGASVVTNGISADMHLKDLKIGNCEPSIDTNNGIVIITWSFSTDNTVSTGSHTRAIKLIYNGIAYEQQFTLVANDTPVIYQLLPSKNEIVFSVNASNEYTPETQTISFGYTANDGTITTYPGTIKSNTCTDGGAPYNMFYRFANADGTFSGWSWVKDIPNTDAFTGILEISSVTSYIAIEVIASSATRTASISDSNIVDKEIIPIIKSGKTGKNGDPGSNGYPGCVTRMFKTNVVSGKIYRNDINRNPNDAIGKVCTLDYMIVFDGTNYYAFQCKKLHYVVTAPENFIVVNQNVARLNSYTYQEIVNKEPSGNNKTSTGGDVKNELWDPVENMDGSAFFTSFTAVSGYIETLSGSAILLTENTNGSSYINAGFRTSLDLNDDDIVLWSGSKLPKEIEDGKIKPNAVDASANNATFRVTKDGTLYAKLGVFSGNTLSLPNIGCKWLERVIGFYIHTEEPVLYDDAGLHSYNDTEPQYRLGITTDNTQRFCVYPNDDERNEDVTENSYIGANQLLGRRVYIDQDNDSAFPQKNVDYVYDINNGLNCYIETLRENGQVLIDLPSYTNKFNRFYTTTHGTPDRVVPYDVHYFSGGYIDGDVEYEYKLNLGEFCFNPTLCHKYINLYMLGKPIDILRTSSTEDTYKCYANIYKFPSLELVGQIKMYGNHHLSEYENLYMFTKLYTNDENTKQVIGSIKSEEYGYKLWVESFVDKVFTLIIPSKYIIDGHKDFVPEKNKIIIRGLKCIQNTAVSNDFGSIVNREKIIYPENGVDALNLFHTKLCRHKIELQGKVDGQWDFLYSDKITKSDTADTYYYDYYTYLQYNYLSSDNNVISQIGHRAEMSIPIGDPVIVMQFKCVKEEGYCIKEIDGFDLTIPFIDIYWKPISYQVMDSNMNNIVILNKVQYF